MAAAAQREKAHKERENEERGEESQGDAGARRPCRDGASLKSCIFGLSDTQCAAGRCVVRIDDYVAAAVELVPFAAGLETTGKGVEFAEEYRSAAVGRPDMPLVDGAVRRHIAPNACRAVHTAWVGAAKAKKRAEDKRKRQEKAEKRQEQGPAAASVDPEGASATAENEAEREEQPARDEVTHVVAAEVRPRGPYFTKPFTIENDEFRWRARSLTEHNLCESALTDSRHTSAGGATSGDGKPPSSCEMCGRELLWHNR